MQVPNALKPFLGETKKSLPKPLSKLESISCQCMGFSDAGFSNMIAAGAKGGPSLKLIDVRNNGLITMSASDRHGALQGMKMFNKQIRVLHG